MATVLLAALVINDHVTHCGLVEVNTYGAEGSTRTAVIYRDFDGSIIAWRWFFDGRRVPKPAPGGWLVCWFVDNRTLRCVKTRRVVRSRTLGDVEQFERRFLPHERRRGLR